MVANVNINVSSIEVYRDEANNFGRARFQVKANNQNKKSKDFMFKYAIGDFENKLSEVIFEYENLIIELLSEQ